MISYILGFTILYIYDKVKKRLISYLIFNSVKLIKYHKMWHHENEKYLQTIEWILI